MLETKLIKKAIRGNAKAYGELVKLYQSYLYKMAFLSVKNEDVALDIVSEAVLQGFQSIKKLKDVEHFKTWMTRILLNKINDYYRSTIETENIDEVVLVESQKMPSVEEYMDLYNAIDRLSAKYREVIILKYFNDMKISEIAYIMDIPEGSVKAYLHRAKAELKDILTEPNDCAQLGFSTRSRMCRKDSKESDQNEYTEAV